MTLEVELLHKSTDWASKVSTIEFTIKGDYLTEFFGETEVLKQFNSELFARLDFGYDGILFTDCEANDIEDKKLLEILENIYQTYLNKG